MAQSFDLSNGVIGGIGSKSSSLGSTLITSPLIESSSISLKILNAIYSLVRNPIPSPISSSSRGKCFNIGVSIQKVNYLLKFNSLIYELY